MTERHPGGAVAGRPATVCRTKIASAETAGYKNRVAYMFPLPATPRIACRAMDVMQGQRSWQCQGRDRVQNHQVSIRFTGQVMKRSYELN